MDSRMNYNGYVQLTRIPSDTCCHRWRHPFRRRGCVPCCTCTEERALCTNLRTSYPHRCNHIMKVAGWSNETLSNAVILQAADNTSFLFSYHMQPIFNRFLLLLFSIVYGVQIVLACLASTVNNVLTILLKYPIVGQRGYKNKSPLCWVSYQSILLAHRL